MKNKPALQEIDDIFATDGQRLHEALHMPVHPESLCPFWGDYVVPARQESPAHVSFGCMALHARSCQIREGVVRDSVSCPVRARVEELVQLSYER